MIGRTPGYIVAVRPLRQGAITDFDVTQRMIRLLLQRVGVSRFNRPRVVICVPSAITAVERRAVIEAARRAGAAEAQLIEQPMAAAIGAGLPDQRAGRQHGRRRRRRHLRDRAHLPRRRRRPRRRCGSGRSTSTPPSRPSSAASTASPSASAPRRRSRSPSARPGRLQDEVKAEVRGRDLMTGLPKTVILSPEEVREAIDEPVSAIVDSVIACLGEAPPELAHDLIVRGMHLVGGGGMLAGPRPSASPRRPRSRCTSSTPRSSAWCSAPGTCIEAYDQLKVMFMGAQRSRRPGQCPLDLGTRRQRPVRRALTCSGPPVVDASCGTCSGAGVTVDQRGWRRPSDGERQSQGTAGLGPARRARRRACASAAWSPSTA